MFIIDYIILKGTIYINNKKGGNALAPLFKGAVDEGD